ncbi:larval cuticle protein 2-like [Eurosta solidaginis]|uniref:larval cuticle protein 2-like n=1 Tax=Eurosta solidaginis TaxID=178769 RepID=UPI003530A08A
MFKYALILAFVAYVSAAAVDSKSDDAHAEVKLQTANVRADGFETALETTNGIHAVRAGDVQGNIQGEFSWLSPEGKLIKVTYVANEQGYQPHGDLLPTPPPIPLEIAKSLQYLSTHPQKEEKKN